MLAPRVLALLTQLVAEVRWPLPWGWQVVAAAQLIPFHPLRLPTAERTPTTAGGPWASARDCSPACPTPL